jgi:putative transposase
MAKRRSSSFVIMRASLDPVSLALRAVSSNEILTIPYQAPRANAICERFLGRVRRECLDHLLILNEKQLHRVLHAYAEYFTRARPHQGIQQQVPEAEISCIPLGRRNELVIAAPILGGLHHDYKRVA